MGNHSSVTNNRSNILPVAMATGVAVAAAAAAAAYLAVREAKRRPKGPRTNYTHPLGAVQVVKNAHKSHIIFSEWRKEHGPFYCARVGTRWLYMVGDVEMIDFVYNQTRQFQTRGNGGMKFFIPQSLLGFTECDKQWKGHRKIVSGAFSDTYLKKYSFEIIKAGNEVAAELLNCGLVTDINDLMAKTAYNILCNTVLGKDWLKTFPYVGSKEELAAGLSTANTLSHIPEILWPYVSWDAKRIAEAHNDNHHRSIKDNVAAIRKDNIQEDSMLHFLAHHESNMNDDEIADELIALVMAGHETTANTLSFALVCLAAHPELQTRAREEVLVVCNNDISQLSYSKLKDLHFLWAIFKETLRLFPTVPINGRVAEEDVHVKGSVIPKGETVIINTYHMCRSESSYPDALKFVPDRWMADQGITDCTSTTHARSFGGGLRICVGKRFAEEESILLLAHLIGQFRVDIHSVGDQLYNEQMVRELDVSTLGCVANVTMTFENPVALQFTAV